jgi:hypothetical protein
MGGGSRVLLVERLSPDRATDDHGARQALMSDMQMMAVLGGMERTFEQFSSLLASTGLDLTRAVPTGGEMHLIEGMSG